MTSQNTNEARKRYYRARVQNLRAQVPMVRVLEIMGVETRIVESVEVQYPCPLHGDGQDNGFSARVYPESERDPGGSTYCWGCHKKRDQIEWVRDYQGLSFSAAMKLLEDTFNVSKIPSIYDYFDPNSLENPEGEEECQNAFQREIDEIFKQKQNRDTDLHAFLRKRDRFMQTHGRNLSLGVATKIYFISDKIGYELQNDLITHDKALSLMQRMATKFLELSR